MLDKKAALQLRQAYKFFRNSTACLEETDSDFAPREGMFTVAGLVAHVAQTFDWFLEGMFRPAGFDLNFARLDKQVRGTTSLEAARKWLKEAVERAVEVVSGKSDEELSAPLPEGPVLGGAPRMAVFDALVDHTAAHRGALTVYARLLGKVPAMPYGEK